MCVSIIGCWCVDNEMKEKKRGCSATATINQFLQAKRYLTRHPTTLHNRFLKLRKTSKTIKCEIIKCKNRK